MIPPFDSRGNLPPGIHDASWREFTERFGTTPRRRYLLEGLKAALESLRQAGCQLVYINGSFVTAKKLPGDFDGCWDAEGVDLDRLDPVFLSFANQRVAQKAKYRGEFFPADMTEGGSGGTFLSFFQTDRDTGDVKDIVRINLESLEP
jgi:hypothetical protein